jgi:hypothetical protein
VISRIAEEICDGKYLGAMRFLARRIASIELFPYHSMKFGAERLIGKLRSAEVARQFVQRVTNVGYQDADKVIIVLRAVRHWDISERHGVVRYDNGLAQSASLGPNSRGGKAHLRKCGISSD